MSANINIQNLLEDDCGRCEYEVLEENTQQTITQNNITQTKEVELDIESKKDKDKEKKEDKDIIEEIIDIVLEE